MRSITRSLTLCAQDVSFSISRSIMHFCITILNASHFIVVNIIDYNQFDYKSTTKSNSRWNGYKRVAHLLSTANEFFRIKKKTALCPLSSSINLHCFCVVILLLTHYYLSSRYLLVPRPTFRFYIYQSIVVVENLLWKRTRQTWKRCRARSLNFQEVYTQTFMVFTSQRHSI